MLVRARGGIFLLVVVQRARAAGTTRGSSSIRPPPLATDDAQPGHHAGAGQRLAAEPERADAPEVVQPHQLARGEARGGQCQVGRADPPAVVGHGEEAHPPGLALDVDGRRAGVEAVLDQLLGDRGRALHHLPRGDFVDDQLGQGLDPSGD